MTTEHAKQADNAAVSGGPMKHSHHPASIETDITCTCGATVYTRSTVSNMRVSVCSNCHPFFTGRQKLIDTEGRVERFTKKFGAQTSESRKAAAAAKTAKGKKAGATA